MMFEFSAIIMSLLFRQAQDYAMSLIGSARASFEMAIDLSSGMPTPDPSAKFPTALQTGPLWDKYRDA
jgi:hypothetical protein